jgi:hypothetical protein
MKWITEKIWNRIKCFWHGHKVPVEWLEYESELGGLSIPCERCDRHGGKRV